jgi:ribonuclease HI
VEPLDLPLELPALWPDLSLCPARDRAPALAWANDTSAALRERAGAAVVFTDGSFDLQSGEAAAAFVILGRQAGANDGRHMAGASRMPTGLAACSFAAEICGIMLAADTLLAMGLPGHGRVEQQRPASVHLFCDSRAALEVLAGKAAPSGYVSLCNAAFKLLDQLQSRGPVSLYWIPGHSGIQENEQADAAAKAALSRAPTPAAARVLAGVLSPYAAVAARIRVAVFREWNRTWTVAEHGDHLRSLVPLPVPPHGRWSSDRRRDVTLCRLRLGQCLNEFLHGVRQAPTPACAMPGCRERESVEHFLLDCPIRNHYRAYLLHCIRGLLADHHMEDVEDSEILSLRFLLGSAPPVSLRSVVGDAVLRYFNDCSSP